MELKFLTADDITILDKAYETYGGLLSYLELELKGKIKDFIREGQWEKIDTESVKADVATEITAEKDAKTE